MAKSVLGLNPLLF